MSSTLSVRFCRNLQGLMMFDLFVRRRFCRNLSSSSTNGRHISVAYHIVPQCLSFTDLRLLQPLSRLPTFSVRFCRNFQGLMMFDLFVRRRFCRNLSSSSTNGRRLSVAYHIVPQCLSFTDLRLLQPLSRLPTLLPGNSIVVTNNYVSGFAVDGVLITEPDLFLSSQMCH
ncbi:hypothetical protein F2Q69_00039633 [Brassica cretica]|uniref:Uncharacterized protein n=1 Tax=Brassica cretica TaxID=69181 RepID=A0A8S9NIM9_BRACR|nr:hypothetical protein F2Q69_00039633 [Brassica cretica]